MKINNIGNIRMNPYKKQLEKQEELQKTSKADKVEISSEAKELQKGNKIEELRQEKVERLKQQVQTGQYNINPEGVAKKLIEFFSGK